MKRRGFFVAVVAACAAPLVLATKVAKPKLRWRTLGTFYLSEDQMLAQFNTTYPDIGAWARRSGKSTMMAENFRRAYGRRV